MGLLPIGVIANSFYIDKCVTTSEGIVGPQKAVECIFPMRFKEKIYNGCVPDRNEKQECDWCSTKGNYLWSIGVKFFMLPNI